MVAAHGRRMRNPPDNEQIAQSEETEFSVLKALAQSAPEQAIIDAWGLLEYQLNGFGPVAPDQPHGWPQVADNLRLWPKMGAHLPGGRGKFDGCGTTRSVSRQPLVKRGCRPLCRGRPRTW